MKDHIKHIFFDLDNTLWDFDKNSREALYELFMRDSIEEVTQTNFSDFLKTYEAINHQLWIDYGLKKTTKEHLRVSRFSKTFDYFNYSNDLLAKKWADDYLNISPYKKNLIPDTLDVLDYLRKNYQLHLITNGFKEVQYIKLNQSNLKKYFKNIIISEEHGFNKPNIELFKIAENLSQTNKNECVMIGDNFEADIEGALNAGWKAIYFTPNKIDNHHCISDLLTLKTIF